MNVLSGQFPISDIEIIDLLYTWMAFSIKMGFMIYFGRLLLVSRSIISGSDGAVGEMRLLTV
jgi:hypothetical protein